MKKTWALAALLYVLIQPSTAAAQPQSNIWQPVNESVLSSSQSILAKNYKPETYKVFSLQEGLLRKALANAPSEKNINAGASSFILSIPTFEGTVEHFKVVEAPVMEDGLAAKYPDIKSYAGQGVDHPASTIRFDVSPEGFHGMILSSDRKTVYINPADKSSGYYVVFEHPLKTTQKESFHCAVNAILLSHAQGKPAGGLAHKNADDGKLRTYKLATSSGAEFSALFLDGSETTDAKKKAKVLAGLVTDLTRVNGIYEADFGIRLVFITNEDALIFLDADKDPFLSDASGYDSIWSSQSQTTLDSIIGNKNYDIGHLLMGFNTGGNAGCIGCVCNDATKGNGVTGYIQATGDPFVVDFWAHELGHQFGANHTFTYSYEGTIAQMEPGSASTIMGYAGTTGSFDVQSHSDPYFHAISIQQITDYVKSATEGGACAAVTSTGNHTPTANAGSDFTIPNSTPFMLTGAGTDADAADVLSYCWEQFDNYEISGSNTIPTSTATTGPLFRSYLPVNVTTRTFPQLSTILQGKTASAWEALPAVGRTMNFRLTVRDNHTAAGNNKSDDMVVTVAPDSGPFAVSYPNLKETWEVGDFKSITWNVANTTASPVSCPKVDLLLSTDGGASFPVKLATGTPNDGKQEIVVPANITAKARIKVMSSNNIFFDISDSNFAIVNAAAAGIVFNNPDAFVQCSTATDPSLVLRVGGVGGFNSAVTLSASGNPSGTTVGFSKNPVAAGDSATVTMKGTVPPGTYNLVIKGTAGTLTQTKNLSFVIGAPTGTPTLVSPVNNAIGQSIKPLFTWNSISGADDYTLEVATDAGFSTIVQTVNSITATSYQSTIALKDNSVYYWRISGSNSCGTGSASNACLFKTTAINCLDSASRQVPVIISASGTPTVTSTVTINANKIISDINVVGLVGQHDYVNDLTVSLRSPKGTQIILFDQICNSDQNFDLNLDDDAGTATFPCPPTGGATVRPQQKLSSFNGENAKGDWTLIIKDNYDQDGGKLTGWGLKICSSTATSLPVQWLSFTGHKGSAGSVVLNWSTANEINNDHYVVERSADGVTFSQVGTVAGGGNTGIVVQYIYVDLKPMEGDNYYRLKQVDADGQFTYSTIIKVTIDFTKGLWVIYPNPASDQVTIKFLSDVNALQLLLADASGKVIYNNNKGKALSGETINIPVSRFSKGVYLLKIKTDKATKTDKVFID